MGSDKKRMITVYLVTIFFVTFDRFFKDAAIGGLFEPPIRLLGNVFSFNFTKNYYIAFSIPISGLTLNIVIILIILALIIYLFLAIIRKKDYAQAALFFLIIAGATSNLVDRLRLGYVIDYFDLKYFTVFNLADVMIVGGVALLCVTMYRHRS